MEKEEMKARAARLCRAYNKTGDDNPEQKDFILNELLASVGENLFLEVDFNCLYGKNIHIGKDELINYDATFLDEDEITIGDNCYIGPRSLLVATDERPDEKYHCKLKELRKAPIVLEDKSWLCGDVTIAGGVTIGEGSIIGAGAVVYDDIPPHVIAGGDPCKVIRPLTDDDKWGYDPEVVGRDHGWEHIQKGEMYFDTSTDLEEMRAVVKKYYLAYNRTEPDETELRRFLLEKIFKSVGENTSVDTVFRTELGCNTTVGDNVVIKEGFELLDMAEVTIGDNTEIGPRCGLYAVSHGFDPEERAAECMISKPIHIGKNVTLGEGCVMTADSSVGDGTVVEPFSVITGHIPAGVRAGGIPCRVIGKL